MREIEKQLLAHEGMRIKPYRCSAGKLTIGVGRNIEDKGITEEEALFLLRNDIAECEADLKTIFPRFDGLDDIRKRVLIDMRFNLGPAGIRNFKNMIDAVNKGDFNLAALEMKNSKWFRDVPNRSAALCGMMASGVDQVTYAAR